MKYTKSAFKNIIFTVGLMCFSYVSSADKVCVDNGEKLTENDHLAGKEIDGLNKDIPSLSNASAFTNEDYSWRI